MADRSTLTELRLLAYRRILPIVVLAFVASWIVPARLAIGMRFDVLATPAVAGLLLGVWALAMFRRIPLRALDLSVQLSAGIYLLAKVSYLSWTVSGTYWWEFLESALYLPVFFALIFWANERSRAWNVSWGFLAAFLLLALPYLLRIATTSGSVDHVVAYVHLHVPIVAVLMILFLSAYGRKEHVHVQSMAEAEIRAQTDPLTRLDNRGGLEHRLEACLRAFERSGSVFTVILADLDRFKKVNDDHGHNVGDAVLREFARTLRARVRGEDHVGRWGGEEFAVVLPETPLQQATELAEQLRLRVREASYPNGVSITASFGVAEVRERDTIAALIGRADAALYAAKRGGRDQVRVDGSRVRVLDVGSRADGAASA